MPMILMFLWILCSCGSLTQCFYAPMLLCTHEPMNQWSPCSCESCAPVDLWLYASMLLWSFAPMIPMFLWILCPCGSMTLCFCDCMVLWSLAPMNQFFLCSCASCASVDPWLFAPVTLCFYDSKLLRLYVSLTQCSYDPLSEVFLCYYGSPHIHIFAVWGE